MGGGGGVAVGHNIIQRKGEKCQRTSTQNFYFVTIVVRVLKCHSLTPFHQVLEHISFEAEGKQHEFELPREMEKLQVKVGNSQNSQDML